jgi:hypothetical protein
MQHTPQKPAICSSLHLQQLLPRNCCLTPPRSHHLQQQLPPVLPAGQRPVIKRCDGSLLLLPLPQLPQLAEGLYMTACVAHMPANAIEIDMQSIGRL